MITSKDSIDPYSDRPIVLSDQNLMNQIIQQRVRTWGFLWLGVLLVCLCIGCYVLPQSYTATVSLSMQQNSSGGALGLLIGGGSSSKYLGVLKSRMFQEKVEDKIHLQQLYHLQTRDEALTMIKNGTRIDDNVPDGLIYVDMTLTAPARLAPHSAELREQVRIKDAEAANVFPDALADYLENNATDSDLVLLRFGQREVNARRQLYVASMNNLMQFLKDRHMNPRVVLAGASPSPSSSATDLGSSSGASGMSQSAGPGGQSAGVAGTRLGALYLQKEQYEAQLYAAQEMRKKLEAILTDPLSVVPNMPAEDPLLANARSRYVQAKQTLEEARLRFGPENPQRVTAEASMQRAETNLLAQAKTMLEGKTTENLRIENITANLEETDKHIKEAEKLFSKGRTTSADMGRLTNDVALNLRALETAMTSFEDLKIKTVSGRSRSNVVDRAEPALHSKPGLFSIGAASMAMAFVTVGIWFGLEFLLKKTRMLKTRMNLLAH